MARDPFESVGDEVLMRRYQHGDAAAFAALMRRHLNGVYNFLARQVGGRSAVAEDLAQWMGTNEYEVMTNISTRVPRVYIDE